MTPETEPRPIQKQMVSPQTAADMIGVSRYTVRRWIKAGTIKATKFSSATIRIAVAEIERVKAERAA